MQISKLTFENISALSVPRNVNLNKKGLFNPPNYHQYLKNYNFWLALKNFHDLDPVHASSHLILIVLK